jgi:hypothetical protein
LVLKEEVLDIDDFDLDDVTLVKKINQSGHNVLTSKMEIMEKTKKILNKRNKSRKLVYKKFRHIDPDIIDIKTNRIFKLSELDKEYKTLLKESKVKNNEGVEFSPLW